MGDLDGLNVVGDYISRGGSDDWVREAELQGRLTSNEEA